jgi:ribosomal protein S18 acetylase RimI-like enzyme
MTSFDNEPQLRILRLEEYPMVRDIFNATFPTKYSDEFRIAWMGRATAYSWGLWEKNKLQGFVLTSFQESLEHSYHIHFLGIDPSVQKGGFGTTLLHKVLQQASDEQKPVSLIPLANERLIRWYEKQGFSYFGKPFMSPYTGEEERLMLHKQPTKG